MKVKSFLCLFFAFCMSLLLCVSVFASEPKSVEIAVNDEQDIVDFMRSDKFDPDVAYTFVYPDAPVMTRALCSKCGYNSLVGKTIEEYDYCHESSQGMGVTCLDMPNVLDYFYVLLTKAYQYCNTCGYTGPKTFSESKYYIRCAYRDDTVYVATNYKTRNRLGDPYEWKDTWSLYYSDPHA